MMKKLGVLYLLILISILLCSCAKNKVYEKSDELSSKSITIEKCEYVYENVKNKTSVKIHYPQINGLKDVDIQTKINTNLKDGALKDFASHWNMEGLTLEIDYDLANMSGYYISVKFHGTGESGSYPTNLGYAININLSTGNIISLEEIMDVDGLLSILNSGKFNLEVKDDFILEEYTYQELAERYKDLAMSELELPRYNTFYFTTEMLGIYIYFPHVLGDYRILEIDFNDINSDMRYSDLFWDAVDNVK